MTSTATVHRAGGKTTGADGFEIDGYAAVQTGAPFRLGGSDRGGNQTRRVVIGDVETQVAVRTGHLPHDFAGLRDGDLIEITRGENVGVVLRVVEATGADQQTALRVPVYEVPRPAGL